MHFTIAFLIVKCLISLSSLIVLQGHQTNFNCSTWACWHAAESHPQSSDSLEEAFSFRRTFIQQWSWTSNCHSKGISPHHTFSSLFTWAYECSLCPTLSINLNRIPGPSAFLEMILFATLIALVIYQGDQLSPVLGDRESSKLCEITRLHIVDYESHQFYNLNTLSYPHPATG